MAYNQYSSLHTAELGCRQLTSVTRPSTKAKIKYQFTIYKYSRVPPWRGPIWHDVLCITTVTEQTTNKILTHKRYPISHLHRRAMWRPLWGFGENWPPYNGSTLHYDLDDGRSHYHQRNKMFALESFSLHDVGTDRLHKDGWKLKQLTGLTDTKPCTRSVVWNP